MRPRARRLEGTFRVFGRDNARVGVTTVNQARPPIFLQVIRHIHTRGTSPVNLRTVRERVHAKQRHRVVRYVSAAFHIIMQRGFDLSCALAAQVLPAPARRGALDFQLPLRETVSCFVSEHWRPSGTRAASCFVQCPVRATDESSSGHEVHGMGDRGTTM